ncbi:START-like domain-containing protein [Saprospira sp. CCB-QB6]|uniref:START-like domain-containing protein n=1 Tax=Saprospira sp. CCB-QB6 TaxID=3023936 RepID=UPI00234BA4A9|nr:START-like domain-containing protein [Saprospira sp. CCB-QB6]WCL82047.1 START-like domain-containing protein [Saprospira sp. CCB-QB6]
MNRKKFKVEFLFRASPKIVYSFLSTPDNLTRWFCDDCNLVEGQFSFDWEGNEEIAYLLESQEDSYLRLQWEDFPDEYLEYKMSRSEVTAETILEITAFCDADEVDEEKDFWANQMESLRRAMGG